MVSDEGEDEGAMVVTEELMTFLGGGLKIGRLSLTEI